MFLMIFFIALSILTCTFVFARNSALPVTVAFEPVNEPNEGALSLLVPKGWQIQAGVYRVDLNYQWGPSQTIAAK